MGQDKLSSGKSANPSAEYVCAAFALVYQADRQNNARSRCLCPLSKLVWLERMLSIQSKAAKSSMPGQVFPAGRLQAINRKKPIVSLASCQISRPLISSERPSAAQVERYPWANRQSDAYAYKYRSYNICDNLLTFAIKNYY